MPSRTRLSLRLSLCVALGATAISAAGILGADLTPPPEGPWIPGPSSGGDGIPGNNSNYWWPNNGHNSGWNTHQNSSAWSDEDDDERQQSSADVNSSSTSFSHQFQSSATNALHNSGPDTAGTNTESSRSSVSSQSSRSDSNTTLNESHSSSQRSSSWNDNGQTETHQSSSASPVILFPPQVPPPPPPPPNSGPGNAKTAPMAVPTIQPPYAPPMPSTTTTVPTNTTAPVPVQPVERPLGCFDMNGAWTTNRDECRQVQVQRTTVDTPERNVAEPASGILQQLDAEEERIVEQRIEQSFISNVRAEKQQQIVESLQKAKTRLLQLVESSSTPPSMFGVLDQHLQWIAGQIAVFNTSTERPVEAIEGAAARLSDVLASVDARLQEHREASGTPSPDIASILERTGRVMQQLQRTMNVLIAEKISMEPNVLQQYSRASSLQASVLKTCPHNLASCGQLRDVMDIVSAIKDPLLRTIESIQDPGTKARVTAAMEGK